MTVPSLGTDAATAVPKTMSPEATAVPKAMTAREATAVAWEVIQYGGRSFHCKPEMARIFLKHAREVIESGDEQLVPLLHSGGIELLLVSRATPYSLLDPPEG